MAIPLRQTGVQLVLLSMLTAPCAFAGTITQANLQADALLQQGHVDQASALLKQTLAQQPDNAGAHSLLCRVYYAQDMADAAVSECERAVAQAPNDSDSQMWLGRAYGLKASRVNPLSAFGYARKVHASFERAVELDGSNVRAMSDLGEFYVAAPSIVGGGLDKAENLAEKMQPRFPSQSHRLRGLIAEKKNDLAAAEAEFKAAATAGTPEAYVDLGHFYQRHHQPDKALAPLQAAIEADRGRDAALVDAASILTAAHRSPSLAESVLREYLSSPSKSDAAPAFKVHMQLGNLLASRGDDDGARREYAAALSLASHYAPARKALQGS
jgi:tetratricopeptide (TPR) repeat protein